MTFDLTPRAPQRLPFWPDILLDLRDALPDGPEPIYIVGGAVRDALLQRPIHDLDLAVPRDAMKLARWIADHFNGDVYVLDAERDVGRALVETPQGRMVFDVARLRGEALLDDLLDRDFTINAMAVSLKDDLDQVIDPLGGEADIMAKLLRRCAPGALANDPLRALRAVRQSVQFGLRIEPQTLADVRNSAAELKRISSERLRDELFKTLALPRPVAALRVLDALGLLPTLIPETVALHDLPQSPPHIYDAWTHTLAVVEHLAGIAATIQYTRTDNTAASFAYGMTAIQLDRYRSQLVSHLEQQWPDERAHKALLMLAALLHDAGKPAAAADGRFIGHETIGAKLAGTRAHALRLSSDETHRLKTIVANHMRLITLEAAPSRRAVSRFWRQLGAAGIDVCLLTLADHLGTYGSEFQQDDWLMLIERVLSLLEVYFERHAEMVEPPTLIDGGELIRMFNLKPGRLIGQLLELIRDAQVDGEVQTADDAVRLVREHLDKRGAGE
ncbi:MAG: HD domain-containing protein [Anaerolineae bacterium]|nr:HD domain-containing protein [Anaerolineae bacterium]